MNERKPPRVQVTSAEGGAAQQLVTATQAPVQVTDAQGRKITLKRPGVLAQYRLVELLGDTAKNEVYMGMVLPLIFVTSIDDEAVAQPTTKRQVEALIQRLSDDGVKAVMEGVQGHFAPANEEAQQDAVKK